ncbi:MAG: dihydrolipoyl dehydrogenase [Deltaproteobacteria bacterium HGW-Deltaproteobacteria-15]|jgi:dihydrolipoamide dehydrogenase|nr:MAG: dihydrolipoyl dehydrogenase [Deltaproteobacteria bacterium HGW-Deltaproteobacteria-15]
MYDLAVIGGGPGGYVAAICSARKGLKTLLIEKDALGGTCLNRGCVPTKCFVYDTKLLHSARNSSVLKGAGSLSMDIAKMAARKRGVVKTMVSGLGSIMKSHGIEVIQGAGELTGPGRLKVTREDSRIEEIQAKNVILATGSRPALLPFIKVDGRLVQTTDEALDSEEIPKRIVIIGGGVIGVEMATIYLNLGCEVAILELLPEILMTEDEEVRRAMKTLLEKRGTGIHLKAKAKEVKTAGRQVSIVFENAAGEINQLKADRLLVAAGRSPVLEGIRPDRLGIRMNGPFVQVNGRLETSVKGVYAIGDLVGGMMLAHKASAEAEAAVANILGGRKEVDPTRIPRCIWGVAEIGAVGLSEAEARKTGRPIRVGKFPYSYSGAAQAMNGSEGFVKVIGDSDTGEILGVHIMGEHATDMIGESVMAMTMESAVEDLAEAVKPHPTLSENIMEAARDWSGLAIHAPKKR